MSHIKILQTFREVVSMAAYLHKNSENPGFLRKPGFSRRNPGFSQKSRDISRKPGISEENPGFLRNSEFPLICRTLTKGTKSKFFENRFISSSA